jgi:hypothetical protein
VVLLLKPADGGPKAVGNVVERIVLSVLDTNHVDCCLPWASSSCPSAWERRPNANATMTTASAKLGKAAELAAGAGSQPPQYWGHRRGEDQD